MSRIGSIAAAPFVGDQFVSLYLGDERVPTVPGKPVISFAAVDELLQVFFTAPSDGGSEITEYKLYLDGVLVESSLVGGPPLNAEGNIGQTARMSAVNAVGEGPLSDPSVVFEA